MSEGRHALVALTTVVLLGFLGFGLYLGFSSPSASASPCALLSQVLGEAQPQSNISVDRQSLHIGSYPIRGPLPWAYLPDLLRNEYLLDGNVTLENSEFSHNGPLKPEDYGKPLKATERARWSTAEITERIQRVKGGVSVCSYGPGCDADFASAIKAFPVEGKDVLVIGSETPWAEATLLAHGAKTVTTVDFNEPILEEDAPIQVRSVEELGASGELFDVILSYSSLEHDGLGRYGDPLHPYGDILRMQKLRGFLRRPGLFFLGLPIGKDRLVWNAHRIYGKIRFPLLTAGWRVKNTFGNLDWDFVPRSVEDYIQPLHVLEPVE